MRAFACPPLNLTQELLAEKQAKLEALKIELVESQQTAKDEKVER